MLLQANPFPECVCEAEAILIIGNSVLSIFMLIFLMILMLYFYMKVKRFLPTLILFLFSIIFGMTSFNVAYIPFTPWAQIFFMLYQTIFFYLKIDEKGFKNLW